MNKEQLKYAVDVMSAALNGAAIEFKTKSRDLWIDATGKHTLNWNWEECDYRIKPTKTFRPWTADEIPVGAVVRYKENKHGLRFLITCNGNGSLLGSGGNWRFDDLFSIMEHSTDGGRTWLRCGVEVEA